MYSGPAKKTDPRVQIFTLMNDDIISFYKKISTYNNKYSRRSETAKFVTVGKKRDLRSIQKKILSKNPWHCIPDSLIGYQSWTQTGFEHPIRYECLRHDDSPIESLLNDDIDERDAIFTWDPKIPWYAIDQKIDTSMWAYSQCSQFSNTGALPILEYFYRNHIYPVPIMIGRRRDPPHYGKVREEGKTTQPMGPSRHFERCYVVKQLSGLEAYKPEELEETLGNQNELSFEQLLAQADELLYEDTPRLAPGQRFTEETKKEMSEEQMLDALLNFDETTNDHVQPEIGETNSLFAKTWGSPSSCRTHVPISRSIGSRSAYIKT
jgi:hypothetical protein